MDSHRHLNISNGSFRPHVGYHFPPGDHNGTGRGLPGLRPDHSLWPVTCFTFTPLSSQPRPRRACGPPVRYCDEAHGTTSQGHPSSPILHTITAAALITPPPAQSPRPRPAPPPTDVPIPALPPSQVALDLLIGGSAQPVAERQISLQGGEPPEDLDPGVEEDFWQDGRGEEERVHSNSDSNSSQNTQYGSQSPLPNITSLPSLEEAHNTYILHSHSQVAAQKCST